MKVYIGSDHNGFNLKKEFLKYLQRVGYDAVDNGSEKLDPNDDFPVFTQKVVHDMLQSDDPEPMGILICGSGQGMCMAANRFKGIRAALGYDMESVRSARNDDDANVLCLPAKTLQADETNVLVETFLNTKFAGASRFKRRIHEMDQMG